MAENNNNTTTQEDVNTTEGIDVTKYLEAYNELRANTVSKAEYEKLRKENRDLFNAYTQGQTMNTSPEEPKKSLEELRAEYGKNCDKMNNLNFWEKTLELRDATINAGKPDPFLPMGKKIAPTNEDVECANRVAQVVQECIDYAQGDSRVFTVELNRRTVDVAPNIRRRR